MYLGMNLNNLLMARKDMLITPNAKMKQLQWDKLPQQQVGKTLWNDEEPGKEKEWVEVMRGRRIWEEMEEDFKAKQLVVDIVGARNRLIVVLMTLLMYISCSPAKESRASKCFRPPDQEARRSVHFTHQRFEILM